jgi:F0F1-type ATP synthase alpha subunit
LDDQASEVLTLIKEKKELSEEVVAQLEKAIKEFKETQVE